MSIFVSSPQAGASVAPVSLSITSFTNNKNNVEVGTSITSTILTWVLNGSPSTQSLNQSIGSVDTALRTYTHTDTYTTARTYTLTVGDGVDTASANTSVNFLSKRYVGVLASTTISDAQVIALASSELSTSRVKSFSVSPNNEYIYYCYPASFGAATFTVNGLSSTGWVLVTSDFVNASGATVSYRRYRSEFQLTGTYAIGVT